MLLQFTVVEDNSIWIVDTQFMNFGRVSAPPVPGKDEESVVLEKGKLVPAGFGVYNLEGRKPPQLSTFGVYVVGVGQTIKIFIRANVEIKDFTMPAPIRQVLYEIMPADPRQIEQVVNVEPDAKEKSLTTGEESASIDDSSLSEQTETGQEGQ